MTTKKTHPTSAASKPAKLTDADQQLLLSYPVHTPAEVKSYLKPAEGIHRVAPIAAKFLEDNPDMAKALKLDPAVIRAELAEAEALDAPTAAAYALYRRGYENAMEKRSDITRALFKANRFVQNADDEELKRAFAEVSEWVSATHGHGSATSASDGGNGGGAPSPSPSPGPTPAGAATP